jgi:hypothetical protein
MQTKQQFLDILAEEYPEKYLQIHDLKFSESDLNNYLSIHKNINIDVNSFKNYLGIPTLINVKFQSYNMMNNSNNAVVGDIAMNNSDNQLYVYNGTEWSLITTQDSHKI